MKKIEFKRDGKYDRSIIIKSGVVVENCSVCGSKSSEGITADSSDKEYSTIEICEHCLKELLS